MSIGRILKHWVMSPVPVTLAFPQSSLDAVTKCIEECEQRTSAEFRLIIERSIPAKGLRENVTDAQRAKELFGRWRLGHGRQQRRLNLFKPLRPRD